MCFAGGDTGSTDVSAVDTTTSTGAAGGDSGMFSGANLGKLGAGMQLLGLFMGAGAAHDKSAATQVAYEMQAAVESNKAAIDEWRASDALDRGQQAQFQLGLKKAAITGTQRARFAASGAALDEGSPLHVLQDTEYMGNLDMKTAGDNAAREAWVLRATAANERRNAGLLRFRAGSQNPAQDEFSTLLSGGGQVASSWYRMNRAGTSSSDGSEYAG